MRVVSALVFLAMAAYLGFSLWQRMADPVQTALVVKATMSDSSTMSGLVVRDELVLQGNAEYIDVIVDEGEKVSVGQTVAVVYGSEDALRRAERIDSVAREIESVKAALSGTRSNTSANRDESILDSLVALSASLRSDGMRAVDTRQSNLASLIFRKEVSDATEDYLAELQAAYRDLVTSSAGEMRGIQATRSGTFSSIVDGYEGVSPDYMRGVSPEGLREIISAERRIDEDAIGKLALTFDWYYAAIVSREDAARLETGQTVRLSFGRYYGDELTAKVSYLGIMQGEERLVLFRIDKGLTDMMAVRAVAAELIYSQYTGLRVPLRGLYRYYAGYVGGEDGALLHAGDRVTLTLGGQAIDAVVSEVGSERRYGDLPYGVKADSEQDTRPTRRLVVFCWPWSARQTVPDTTAGGGTVQLADSRMTVSVLNYYDYDPDNDRLCVFTMTGLQAERKKVSLIYAGEEYCLLSSEGDDALREGNEVIVQAGGLYNGKVFR